MDLFLVPFLVLVAVEAAHARSPRQSQSYIFYPSSNRPFSKSPRLKEMRVLHSWKRPEFVFPTEESELALLSSGHYIPTNAIILDADFWSRGSQNKLFVTLPRMKPGIPATLATVSHKKAADNSSLLLPYPDWSWHGINDCESLISVFRVKVDECNRLWVIDAGVVDNLASSQRLCPPKLLVFDLKTDALMLKYTFPEDVWLPESLIVTIAVDVISGRCDDVYAYIADVTEYGLIVFQASTRTSWRVNSNFFYPFPTHGSISINGEQFDLMDGIFGLALSPPQLNGDRTLFFHSLASVREGKVSTSHLRNASNFEGGHNRVSKKFFLSSEVRSSQSGAEGMSSQKVLFFGLMDPPSVACWNAKLPFIPENIVTVARNKATLQFSSGVKVVRKGAREELLVTTSKFQKYISNSLLEIDDNFHILSASVHDLIRNTQCEPTIINHPTPDFPPK